MEIIIGIPKDFVTGIFIKWKKLGTTIFLQLAN